MGFFKNICIHIPNIEDYYIERPNDPTVDTDWLCVSQFFLKPGQFFKHGGKVLECVSSDSSRSIDCTCCDAQWVLPRRYCLKMACDANERPDGRKVIFKIKNNIDGIFQ